MGQQSHQEQWCETFVVIRMTKMAMLERNYLFLKSKSKTEVLPNYLLNNLNLNLRKAMPLHYRIL